MGSVIQASDGKHVGHKTNEGEGCVRAEIPVFTGMTVYFHIRHSLAAMACGMYDKKSFLFVMSTLRDTCLPWAGLTCNMGSVIQASDGKHVGHKTNIWTLAFY
jgi:hypothetical protein